MRRCRRCARRVLRAELLDGFRIAVRHLALTGEREVPRGVDQAPAANRPAPKVSRRPRAASRARLQCGGLGGPVIPATSCLAITSDRWPEHDVDGCRHVCRAIRRAAQPTVCATAVSGHGKTVTASDPHASALRRPALRRGSARHEPVIGIDRARPGARRGSASASASWARCTRTTSGRRSTPRWPCDAAEVARVRLAAPALTRRHRGATPGLDARSASARPHRGAAAPGPTGYPLGDRAAPAPSRSRAPWHGRVRARWPRSNCHGAATRRSPPPRRPADSHTAPPRWASRARSGGRGALVPAKRETNQSHSDMR